MFKIKYLLILCIISFSQTFAQISIVDQYKYLSDQKMIDIASYKNEYYLLAQNSSIYKVVFSGEIKLLEQKEKNISNYKIQNFSSSSFKRMDYKYLCENENYYFACIEEGWSSRIVKIDPSSGKEIFITYLHGIPSGLLVNNNKIWYLYNLSKNNKNGVLICFDAKTGDELLNVDIPVLDAKGLLLDEDNNLVTIENKSQSLIVLKIEEGNKNEN